MSKTLKEYKQWLANFQELITTLQSEHHISDDASIYKGMMDDYIVLKGQETILDIDVENKTITSKPNPIHINNYNTYV